MTSQTRFGNAFRLVLCILRWTLVLIGFTTIQLACLTNMARNARRVGKAPEDPCAGRMAAYHEALLDRIVRAFYQEQYEVVQAIWYEILNYDE